MPQTGNVYVFGKSWCRGTETIDEEIPIAFFDRWFTIRRRMLAIGDSLDHCTMHPGASAVPPERQAEYDAIGEELNVFQDTYRSIGWEVTHPLLEASLEDIDNWFTTRKFAGCAEESAIGVALTRNKAGKLYLRIAHWIPGFDDDEEDEVKEIPVVRMLEEKKRVIGLED